MANEPRLAAGVLVMGGADPPDVLAACDHEIERWRKHILEHLGWSLDEYRNELAKALARINPARFAGMVDPRRVLIIEAAADTCMPRTSRERLWQAMGRPERIAYLYDHRVAFLAMTFLGGNNLQEQIHRFLTAFPLRTPRCFAVARGRRLSRHPLPALVWSYCRAPCDLHHCGHAVRVCGWSVRSRHTVRPSLRYPRLHIRLDRRGCWSLMCRFSFGAAATHYRRLPFVASEVLTQQRSGNHLRSFAHGLGRGEPASVSHRPLWRYAIENHPAARTARHRSVGNFPHPNHPAVMLLPGLTTEQLWPPAPVSVSAPHRRLVDLDPALVEEEDHRGL